MPKRDRIRHNGVSLRKHELATVIFLSDRGYDIELIPAVNIEGVHTPDMKMNGEFWEMKSPVGRGNSLMKNNLQDAVKQANNVVIDLRRVKRDEMKCLRELKREFTYSKNLKRLLVITKANELIDINEDV